MPRQYIVNSWVGAAEYDEGDTYSGEQVGNRDQKSVGVHITRSGDQWYANTSAYAQDDKPAKSQKKKVPIASRIIPAQSTLNRVDQQEKELNQAFENSEIDLEEYEELLYVLEGKRERAHKSLLKALGKSVDTEEVGYVGVEPENACGGAETQCYSRSLSKSEGGIGKIVGKDDIFFLLSSFVVFIVGFMVFS